jgi:hypothetical protein
VLAVIFGLKRIAQDGVSPVPVLFMVAGLAVGFAFVRRQLRLPDPFLDLRLFRTRAFTAALATYGLSILFLFGGFLFLPQFLQLVLGLTPFRAGLWTLPWAFAFVAGSTLTPFVVRRIRPRRHGGRPGGERDRVRDVHARRRVDRLRAFAAARRCSRWAFAPVFTLTTESGRRIRAARARGRRVGHVGDQRRIRRRRRHRDLRQHRRRGLPRT